MVTSVEVDKNYWGSQWEIRSSPAETHRRGRGTADEWRLHSRTEIFEIFTLWQFNDLVIELNMGYRTKQDMTSLQRR